MNEKGRIIAPFLKLGAELTEQRRKLELSLARTPEARAALREKFAKEDEKKAKKNQGS